MKYMVLSIALVLLSCAKSNSTSTQDDVSLLWYGIGGETTDIPVVFDALDQKLEGRGYSVRYERFGWGDYNQKIQLILASGEAADIVFMASWAGNYYSTASNGYLREIDPLLEQTPALKASLSESFWDAVRVGGKIYAVPNYKDMVFQEYAAFNRELLEKHQIQVPEPLTWQNITPVLAQMHQLEPDFIGYDGNAARPIRGAFPFGPKLPIALSFAEPEQGFQVLTEIPEYQSFVRLMREWTEEGYRDKNAYLEKDKDQASMKNWFMRNYQGFPGAEVNLSKSWGVPMQVQWIDGPPILDNSTPLGALLGIPAASPNQEQAIDFISLLNTEPEIRNLVGYGIEGEHYNLNGDGQVVRTEKGLNNYDMPNFSLGSLRILRTIEGEPLNSREDLQDFNDEAEASPTLGFSIDTEKYRQVLAQVSAASEAYFDAVRFGLQPAEETLEEWRSKLRELGWFELVAEINQNYMAWKAAQ